MAKREVYQFLSADKTSRIHGVKWTPDDGKVVAVLQLVHGMVEYIERYTPFAEFLTTKGFAVVGHDHIGHGESVSGPQEWGIMRGEHPSDLMVEDIYQNYQRNKKEFADVPYFILGHSMGSYMLRKTLSVKAKEMADLSGAIIMGTGTIPDATSGMGLAALKVIATFRSWNYRSKFVAGLMYDAPYKQYSLDGSVPENSWLTKDVEIVKKYYQDPKCTFMFSLNAYKGLVESTRYDNNQDNINKMEKDLPIFFVSGDKDPVGNMGKGVREAYDKFVRAGIADVSIKLYENDRHEILNETDRDVVFEDLYQWMKSKM